MGRAYPIRSVKIEWWAAGTVICLKQGANDLHYGPADATATPQFGLTFLVPACPGCPRNEAVKRVSVTFNNSTTRQRRCLSLLRYLLQVNARFLAFIFLQNTVATRLRYDGTLDCHFSITTMCLLSVDERILKIGIWQSCCLEFDGFLSFGTQQHSTDRSFTASVQEENNGFCLPYLVTDTYIRRLAVIISHV